MVFDEVPGCFHDDPPIAGADRLAIQVLDEPEASNRWDKLVSCRHRHLMLLDRAEWPARLVEDSPVFYAWQDDWNADSSESFCAIMRSLEIKLNERVTVFWMRERAIESSWDAFTRNWMNFLYGDEGCIVVPSLSPTCIVFSLGRSWVGQRPFAS